METKLAIVIPAYKADFLWEALTSIANQTNKNFTLYIGDDASPYDLQKIVEEFTSFVNIKYHRFDENMGGRDLVGQWNRCLELIEDEEWCWLFSDDDVLDNNCVAEFYTQKNASPNAQLFHFNIQTIDENSMVIYEPEKFPAVLDVSTFHLKRWKSEISSYVVEYVFSMRYFKDNGGFERFSYAWHTDEATWTKLMHPNGLITVTDAFVKWRRSHVNITPNNRDRNIVDGKLEADIEFTKWVKHFYEENNLPFTFLHQFYLIKRFAHHLAVSSKVLSRKECHILLKKQLDILRKDYLYLFFKTYFNLKTK